MTRICDYEGSRYRADFWENQNRSYEDAVERVAMKKLLPPTGRRLIEIGAGFGRLVDLYQGYDQVFLTDYARTQLEEAQRYLGPDQRLTYVVADVYNLPFVDNADIHYAQSGVYTPSDLAFSRASAAGIETLIRREIGRGIDSTQIIMAGFSQGGAMALFTALRFPEPLAGVLEYSEALGGFAYRGKTKSH